MLVHIQDLVKEIEIPIDQLQLIANFLRMFTTVGFLLAPLLQVIKNYRTKSGSALSNGFIAGGLLEATVYFVVAAYLQYTDLFVSVLVYGVLTGTIYGSLLYQKLVYRSNEYEFFGKVPFDNVHVLGWSIPAFPFVYAALIYLGYQAMVLLGTPIAGLLVFPLIATSQLALEFFHAVIDKVQNRSVLTMILYLLSYMAKTAATCLNWQVNGKVEPTDVPFICLVDIPCFCLLLAIMSMNQW